MRLIKSNNYFYSFIFFISLLVFNPSSLSAETLNEALASAYKYNPQLIAEQARLRATD